MKPKVTISNNLYFLLNFYWIPFFCFSSKLQCSMWPPARHRCRAPPTRRASRRRPLTVPRRPSTRPTRVRWPNRNECPGGTWTCWSRTWCSWFGWTLAKHVAVSNRTCRIWANEPCQLTQSCRYSSFASKYWRNNEFIVSCVVALFRFAH